MIVCDCDCDCDCVSDVSVEREEVPREGLALQAAFVLDSTSGGESKESDSSAANKVTRRVYVCDCVTCVAMLMCTVVYGVSRCC